MADELAFKNQLFEACQAFVTERINTAQQAIDSAKTAANAESKSTAGDKHDTARAMMHLEQEKNAKQLSEAHKLAQVMTQIDPKQKHTEVTLGSVVEASNGIFYLSISAGKLEIDGKMCFAISPVSPIGQALMEKKSGDLFQINGLSLAITNVF